MNSHRDLVVVAFFGTRDIPPLGSAEYKHVLAKESVSSGELLV